MEDKNRVLSKRRVHEISVGLSREDGQFTFL